jgi:hypothetical protein
MDSSPEEAKLLLSEEFISQEIIDISKQWFLKASNKYFLTDRLKKSIL